MPKIALLNATRNIAIKDRQPLIAKENEVVIGVETAGICGPDLALFAGNYHASLPLVCGHEFVDRVKPNRNWNRLMWKARCSSRWNELFQNTIHNFKNSFKAKNVTQI